MNPSNLLTRTATVEHVAFTGVDDGFGDPTETVTTATYKCWLSQRQRSELTDNAHVQAETWDLYLEAAAAGNVAAADRITVDGVEYELDGPPWPAINPRTGETSHVEAFAVRVV